MPLLCHHAPNFLDFRAGLCTPSLTLSVDSHRRCVLAITSECFGSILLTLAGQWHCFMLEKHLMQAPGFSIKLMGPLSRMWA